MIGKYTSKTDVLYPQNVENVTTLRSMCNVSGECVTGLNPVTVTDKFVYFKS